MSGTHGAARAAVRIDVRLWSSPESVAFVRAILAGTSAFLELEPELGDDLRTAVSEACNNAVLHAYGGDAGPLRVSIAVHDGTLEACVADDGVGFGPVTADESRMGVGLAVISALSERAEVQSAPGGGTEVRMTFVTGDGSGLGGHLAGPVGLPEPWPDADADADTQSEPAASGGDIMIRVAPAELVAQVLGRALRTVAARAHFPVDRFAALRQITGAISAFAAGRPDAGPVTVTVGYGTRRLHLCVGPLPAGSADVLRRDPEIRAALAPLLGTIDAAPADDGERLSVTLVPPRR